MCYTPPKEKFYLSERLEVYIHGGSKHPYRPYRVVKMAFPTFWCHILSKWGVLYWLADCIGNVLNWSNVEVLPSFGKFNCICFNYIRDWNIKYCCRETMDMLLHSTRCLILLLIYYSRMAYQITPKDITFSWNSTLAHIKFELRFPVKTVCDLIANLFLTFKAKNQFIAAALSKRQWVCYCMLYCTHPGGLFYC